MGQRSGVRLVVASVAVVLGIGLLPAVAPAGAAPVTSCDVSSGRQPQRATPDALGFDPAALQAALDFAASRNRVNVQVYRNNCLVASGPNNAVSNNVAWNLWSVTKSVVSMLTGIAYDEGKIGLDDPVGKYLPASLGDDAHRAITVRDLLTETAGLLKSIGAEGLTGTVPVDPNIAVQAMGVPIVTPPGSTFSYSQRTVDLLAYVVSRAVGEDLQQFAQRKLFDPLGIHASDYFWARDRSGNTYGYAHLMLPPNDLAKLGLLVGNKGRWNGTQVLSEDYVRRATQPSPRNACYGFLFWLNDTACVDDMGGGLPPDTVAKSGIGLQNAYVIPSLGLMVSWTGVFGNVSTMGVRGTLEHSDELTHNFFRRLLGAIRDTPVPDPGPYVEQPLTTGDSGDYLNTDILLAALGIGPAAYPGCSIVTCLGQPLAPPLSGWPPGCVVQVCVGSDPATPGIR